VNKQKLEDKLQKLEQERSEALQTAGRLWDEIQPLQERVSNFHLEDHFKNGITFESVLALDWLELDKSREWYRKITDWIGYQPGVYASGYFPDTGQGSVTLVLDKDKPWEEQRTIEQIVPYLKPLKDGMLHIRILEQTCSEFGSYGILLPPDLSRIDLNCCSYGRNTILKSFTNWDEALPYLHQHHHSG
jgi:hypothetical protein